MDRGDPRGRSHPFSPGNTPDTSDRLGVSPQQAGDKLAFAKWTSTPTTPPPSQTPLNRSPITPRDLATDNGGLEALLLVENRNSMSPRYSASVTKLS